MKPNLAGRYLRLFLIILGVSAVAHGAPAKIGVLLKGRSDFWAAMQKGAEAAGAKLGVEVIVKSPPSEADVAVQIKLLQVLAGAGIQALVIAPCSADALAGPVATLASKGVKIGVVDTQLPGVKGSVFVGTDQRAAGAAAGGVLAGLVKGSDEVGFFKHSQSSGATLLREAGALDKLRAADADVVVHGDIYASSEAGVEAERSALLLSKYPGVKAVFASGTPGSMAMLQTLSASKTPGAIKLIGCGFNLNPVVVKGLETGVMSAWVAQLPHEVGYKGVESAVSLVNGQTVPASVPTDFLVVTKDNLSDPKIQALLCL